MSESGDEPSNAAHRESSEALPQPKIRKMRWPFPLIWIVPIVAAALAGYYLFDYHREHGLELEIQFTDGSGLTKEQTTLQVRGVIVGRVQAMTFSDDHKHAIAHCRINTDYSFVARQHTQFWLVKPELSLNNISGLSTIVSGPYIEARPGDGPPVFHFDGLLEPPIIDGPGVKVVLHADQLGQLVLRSPVMYRGIEVGLVQDIRLSDEADAANVTLYIWEPYSVLIRNNTQFWPEKGIDLKGGLFGGVKLKVDSLRALLTGGVAFATPENPGPEIQSGAQFNLNEQSKPEWLKWKPKIRIPGGQAPVAAQPKEQSKGALPSLKKE